jgi:hypothetical protein
MSELSPDGREVTLAEARLWLREHLDDGVRCPCCNQHAQIYRWSLYGSAARMLIRLWQAGGTVTFVESKAVKRPGDGGHTSQLALWSLVEHEPDRRPDGGKSGWWRVTGRGERFLKGQETISKYAYVYDGVFLRHDGPQRNIEDVLGEPFDWREHMGRLD